MKQERKIYLSCGELSYILDRGRRRNLYLCVKEGRLIVRAPQKQSIAFCEKFIRQKQDWILSKLSAQRQYCSEYQYTDGEIIDFCGKKKRLSVIIGSGRQRVISDDDNITVYSRNGDVKGIVQKYLDSELQTMINEMSGGLIALTKLKPECITLRRMSASFGRCSGSRNIVLSKKLIHYPPEAVEYVVLHELCHLKYMNHSKDFWNLVESYMPDFRQRQKLLK